MSDLTTSQKKLAAEIKRLCKKTHHKDHVVGWELQLWRACLGDMLPTVTYSDMARLLSLAREAGGWMLDLPEPEGITFIPQDKWNKIVKQTQNCV